MTKLLIVGFGGFVGAILRYLVSGLFYRIFSASYFPSGTLAVNLIGSFLLGLMGGISFHIALPPQFKLFFAIGLLGAFTTFSTFSMETMNLLKNSSLYYAFVNIFISITAGLVFVFLGFYLGRYLFQGR